MRLNAYILAADPAWIEASVLSFYDLVDRIVVSYDENSIGYTGVGVDVEQCLRRLRAIDKAGKCEYRPGHFGRSEFFRQPMENETHQRRVALEQASAGADWVLQLDTDEVLADAGVFKESLEEARRCGRRALNFPAIWLYSHAKGRWYLELGLRGWRRAAGYPGPLAVAAGARLSHARRLAGEPSDYYHVDVTGTATSFAFPNNIKVDRVISVEQAAYHFSWVRSEEWLRRKLATWSHSADKNWSYEFLRWTRATKRPLWAALRSQFERGPSKRPLRFTRIPAGVARLINASADDNPMPSNGGVAARGAGPSALVSMEGGQ
jgi:hypothetical protein